MRAAIRAAALLGCLVLAASPAEARQLDLSLEQSIGGESNVFRSSAFQVADGTYEVAPSIALSELGEKLDYRLSYRPSYEVFFVNGELNGFDHEAHADIEWKPSAFDTVTFEQLYLNARRLRADTIDDPFATLGDVLLTGRERIERARSNLAYNHAFTPYWSGDYEGEFEHVDFTENQNADEQAFTSLLRLNYSPRSGTRFGAEVLGRFRSFKGRNEIDTGSDTIVAGGGLVLYHAISQTLDFEVHLGATFLSETENDPVGFQTPRFAVSSSGATVVSRVVPAMPAGAPFCSSDVFGAPNFERCPFEIVDANQLPPNADVPVSAGGLRGSSTNTVFASGSVLIQKRLRAGSLALEYTRGEAGNTRDGASNIRDVVAVSGIWRPVREWRWKLNATWTHWKSANDFLQVILPAVDSTVPTMVGGSSNFAEVATSLFRSSRSTRRETNQVGALLSGRYFLSDQLSFEGRFRYIFQQVGTTTATSRFDSFSGSLAVIYAFEPLVF